MQSYLEKVKEGANSRIRELVQENEQNTRNLQDALMEKDDEIAHLKCAIERAHKEKDEIRTFFGTPAEMLLAQSIQSKDLLTDKVSQFILKHARINGTQEIKQVRLLFRASLNGWKSTDFHRYCDDKGPTLCLFRSSEDYLSAGFTSKSWQST